MIYEHAGFPPTCTSFLSFACAPHSLHCRPQSHCVIPASEPEFWAALCWGIALLCRLAGIHPRLRPAGSRIKCGMTGTVCAAVPSHPSALPPSLSFRPPSRNPGWIYARYCIALPPRHCHPRTCPPRPRVGARGDRQRGKRGDKGLPYT